MKRKSNAVLLSLMLLGSVLHCTPYHADMIYHVAKDVKLHSGHLAAGAAIAMFLGCAYIDISSGGITPEPNTEPDELDQFDLRAMLRDESLAEWAEQKNHQERAEQVLEQADTADDLGE